MSGESLVKLWIQLWGYRLLLGTHISLELRESRVVIRHIRSISRRNSKGKTPMTNTTTQTLPSDEAQCIAHILFGLARMEEYYVSIKENRLIHAETQFEVESFGNDFPHIYYQIDMRDWGPLTIPVDHYFPELVWEFYAFYRDWKCILRHKGQVDTMPCLPSV
ncbi:hypothetical protein HAX54_041206 [Datura stramonium]|uniref:Uncharacterized protein n=1 Tax=Datura stramonium TaxID=4076 RepID=A0ABS8VRH0_DATST|nr:hypothetical protein [Datura stramonium]